MSYTTSVELLNGGLNKVIIFSGLTTGDTTDYIEVYQSFSKSIILTGTSGGATIEWQGSLDLVNWYQISLISVNSGSFNSVNTRAIRFAVTGGSGVDLTISVFLGRRFSPRL